MKVDTLLLVFGDREETTLLLQVAALFERSMQDGVKMKMNVSNVN